MFQELNVPSIRAASPLIVSDNCRTSVASETAESGVGREREEDISNINESRCQKKNQMSEVIDDMLRLVAR